MIIMFKGLLRLIGLGEEKQPRQSEILRKEKQLPHFHIAMLGGTGDTRFNLWSMITQKVENKSEFNGEKQSKFG